MSAPPSEQELVEQILVYDGVAGWLGGDVLLTLWKQPAREARVNRVSDWMQLLLADGQESFAACQFLLQSARPPDRRGRAAAKAGLRRFGPKARRLISVPLGSGLWQRLVRTIIRAAVRIFGHAWLVKVAANEAQAFALLEQVATDRTPSRAELVAALARLYVALDLVPPAVLAEQSR